MGIAVLILRQLHILQKVHEREGVSKVLDAAALTYVAALVSSIMQLLYLLSRERR